jgi:Fe-S cluster assembly protein SufD
MILNRGSRISDPEVKTVQNATTLKPVLPDITLPPPGFSREALESLSASRQEPNWMLEKRYEGWYHYQEMDAPFWRRTDIGRFHWEEVIPFGPAQRSVSDLDALPPKLHEALATYGQRAGLILQRDSSRVYLDLSTEAREQGVIWTDMHTAVREHPKLVRKHLMGEAVPSTTGKFTALHAAFWSGGTLLYVPKNVTIDLPFVSVLWQEMPQLAVLPPTLLVAEVGSSVTFVSELLSMGCDTCPDTYHGGVTELYLGADAEVRFVNVQDFGRQVYDLRTQTALLERDSRLEWLTINLGARLSRSTQHSILGGPGAEAKVTGLYLPDGKQHFAFHTLQDHVVGNCFSDLLYQGALMGRSRSIYEGTIRAWPDAQNTNAYQSNRNLMLSDKARADSLPRLEIEANDLRCSHGATVSQVDDSQVFYLMSRGIPRADAVRLIVEGFFQPSLDRLPASLEGLRARLTNAIAAKLRGERY